jgi:hypothetical protein
VLTCTFWARARLRPDAALTGAASFEQRRWLARRVRTGRGQGRVLALGDTDLTLALAENTALAEGVQGLLVSAGDPRALVRLALNPALDGELAVYLWSRQGDPARALLSNPALPRDLMAAALDRLAEVSCSGACRLCKPLASSSALEPDDQEALAAHTQARRELARRSDLTSAVKERLRSWAREADEPAVHKVLARAGLLEEGTVAGLASSSVADLRGVAACAVGLTAALQEQLADDPSAAVVAALAHNPALTPGIQRSLDEKGWRARLLANTSVLPELALSSLEDGRHLDVLAANRGLSADVLSAVSHVDPGGVTGLELGTNPGAVLTGSSHGGWAWEFRRTELFELALRADADPEALDAFAPTWTGRVTELLEVAAELAPSRA